MDKPPRIWHILMVEDEPEIQEMNRNCLDGQGYDLAGVYTGEDCLEHLKTHPVDLILLDVELPGIYGFEVCRQVRAQKDLRQPSIIMLTGFKLTTDKVTGLESGADDYLTKPYDADELLARVRAQLRIRELQEKLVEAEKMALIGQTVVALSDQINSPLTAIIWQARLMQSDLQDAGAAVPGDLTARLDNIVRDANRISQVLTRLQNIKKLVLTKYDGFTTMIDLDKSSR